MNQPLKWAAVLAGGNGERLRAFTKQVLGEERPKQFCRLVGRHTLLGDTKRRVCQHVERTRVLYALSRAHESYYREELNDVDRRQYLEQPANRGTTAAVAYALARLRALGARGVLGLFPADHYYRDAAAFRGTVGMAYAVAEAHPHAVVLVGAEADRAETEYGWIEPGEIVKTARVVLPTQSPIRRVARFREKPSVEEAAELLAAGCLWNTFVVIGQTTALERLLLETVPDIWSRFEPLTHPQFISLDWLIADEVYRDLPVSDFSRDVLGPRPDRLLVVNLPESGWTDLGQPRRVLDVLGAGRGPERRTIAS